MNRSVWFSLAICVSGFLFSCAGNLDTGGGGGSTLAATHFSIVPATFAPTAGAAFKFTVSALDASNAVVSSYAGMVHFTSTDSQAVFSVNPTSLTNGMGTFSVTMKTAGSQTITATDTATASIVGISSSITVTGPATHFSIKAPTAATVGAAFNFMVTAQDASNNTATSYSGTVHFMSTDPQGVLPANSTLTRGMGTFSATLNTLGGQTITATDTVTALITGTSNSIVVFTRCGTQGQECGVSTFPRCCPGLVCEITGLRGFCTSTPSVHPGGIEPDPLAFEEASRFKATCTMETPRESHTATLLSNTLVLITGGDDRNVSLATAELFNPNTHSFVPTGDMVDARARHTATLLTNGAVLVIGGRDASGNALATAELFNPANISFAPTGSMGSARESHTATLLKNGKVLVTGGDNGNITLATAEVFDPSTGGFTSSSSMSAARGAHTATLLKNGKVLVTGGRDANGNVLATAELFDPNSGGFVLTDSMHVAREFHAATLLGDGKVLITGGDNGTEVLATVELFDPATGKFTLASTMHAAREFHTATLRNDGTVLIAGGADFTSALDGSAPAGILPGPTAMAELFNPATGSFTLTSDMSNARAKHAALLLTDGKILVTGGTNISSLAESLASAELFQ